MYGIYANIWGILMVNVTIYSIHGSYGLEHSLSNLQSWNSGGSKSFESDHVDALYKPYNTGGQLLWRA